MNKKMNTVLFMIGATVVNILLMLVLLVVMIALIGALFPEPSSGLAQFLLIAAFLLALGGSFGLYTLIIKLITRKVDMEKYFHPIFKPRGGRKPPLR
jgi:O-antigen/teichoic acid export membrane protein